MNSSRQILRFSAWVAGLTLIFSTILLAHGDQQHVMGTITKIEAGSISVRTVTGEVKQVMILASTKFVKGTLAVTLQDLKVGDRVVIHANAEGKMLHATEVKIGQTADSQHHD